MKIKEDSPDMVLQKCSSESVFDNGTYIRMWLVLMKLFRIFFFSSTESHRHFDPLKQPYRLTRFLRATVPTRHSVLYLPPHLIRARPRNLEIFPESDLLVSILTIVVVVCFINLKYMTCFNGSFEKLTKRQTQLDKPTTIG